jgi:hypothetical protein
VCQCGTSFRCCGRGWLHEVRIRRRMRRVTPRSSHAARLLKTLVFAGASLGVGSCGGESRRTVAEGAGAGGTGGAGAAGGMGGASAGTNGGLPAAGASAAGAAGSASSIVECASTSQRVCECLDRSVPAAWACTPSTASGASISCHCDPSLPSGPADCAYTTQFTCLAYSPEYEACRCNEFAPPDATACQPGFFSCVSSDPPIGCECVVPIK